MLSLIISIHIKKFETLTQKMGVFLDAFRGYPGAPYVFIQKT